MIVNDVERGLYLDSVALMRVSRRVAALHGVEAAALMIGTPSNKTLLREARLLATEGEGATPNDLIIAIRGTAAREALEPARRMLQEKESVSGLRVTRTLAAALYQLPQANLALISVPGEFAALEARKALERGLHALVFSDNVAIDDEVALKRLANERGLLLMGPDCGGALIAGTPVAFANAVPRGDVGIVSASGTGLQEVSSLIARLGGGVSHGIGVGGRDLDERVGALGMLAALDALEDDPQTRTIVLISKPPAPEVARRVMARVERARKRCVVCFLGANGTLAEAAEQAMQKKIERWQIDLPPRRRGGVRGLFCGGTFAAEAEMIFRSAGKQAHAFVDLGDDRYTRGRPHPMIEPELRNEHVAAAMTDPDVAVLLFDVVLGYGAHANPAAVLLAGLKGSSKLAVASVTGTEQDPQVWSRQVALLREAGVLVAPSNAHAAELAASLI